MICYHHTDTDGKAAGFLVHKYCLHKNIEDLPESYILFDYGNNFDKHTEKDDVFLVDISLKECDQDKLFDLCKTARSVLWIDHHKSSIEFVNKYNDSLQSIENLTYFVSDCACGAALTYAFFKGLDSINRIRNTTKDEIYNISATYEHTETLDMAAINLTLCKRNKKNPTDAYIDTMRVTLPQWIAYVDDYDCWKKINEKSNFFKMGLDAEDIRVAVEDKRSDTLIFNPLWDNIENVAKYIENGKVISKYVQSRYAQELKNTFEWEFEGTKFICKNGTGDSFNFGALIQKYPAAILFKYNGDAGMWGYSVYSCDKSKFDCSNFAKRFGGGGHFHASGFASKDLIFTSNNKETRKEIFLGGVTTIDWRERFIQLWKKSDSDKVKEFELFNPIVSDWNEEAVKKENEVKENAKLNLFLVTPDQKGPFTYAEIIECCHLKGKVYFAVIDNNNLFDQSFRKSLDNIGKIVEKYGGIYKFYEEEDSLEELVNDVIKAI